MSLHDYIRKNKLVETYTIFLITVMSKINEIFVNFVTRMNFPFLQLHYIYTSTTGTLQ